MFNPSGVAVDVVQDHLVLKTSAGDMGKFTSLVSVNGVSGVVGLDIYVLLLWKGWCLYVEVNELFGGLYAL